MSVEQNETLTVASWNILYDDRPFTTVAPQAERYKNCAQDLLSIGKKLDVVTLYEVESCPETGVHYGEAISNITQAGTSVWQQHKRDNESIGIFGDGIENVEFVDLGYGASAVIGHIGEVSVTGLHLSYGVFDSNTRYKESKKLIDHLKDHDKSIVMGDFNAMAWQKARKYLDGKGYESAFKQLGKSRRSTYPTRSYAGRLAPGWQRLLRGPCFPVDDLYVKGLQTIEAGYFEGDSDHRGLWATIQM